MTQITLRLLFVQNGFRFEIIQIIQEWSILYVFQLAAGMISIFVWDILFCLL